MVVKINGENVELRFTFDAFTEYERIFNEPLGADGALDKTIVFMYLTILCSKKGWQTSAWLSYQDFREWLNDDPNMYVEVSEWIGENMNITEKLTGSKKKLQTKK